MTRSILVLCLLSALLVIFPFYIEVYYTSIYYTGLVLIIGAASCVLYWRGALQKRFYKRWKRERHQKTGWIILKETIRSSVTMFMYVSTGFFMVEGLLPTDILYAFLTNPSGLSAFLIVNAAAGTTARFENEKRYNRIVDEWMDEGRSFPDAKE